MILVCRFCPVFDRCLLLKPLNLTLVALDLIDEACNHLLVALSDTGDGCELGQEASCVHHVQ